MGAMLVGMVTGFMMWVGIIIEKIIIAIILFIAARYLKMSAFKWGIVGLLLDFWTVLFFVITVIRLKFKKCKSCGTRVGNIDGFCPNCGEETRKTDDGQIVAKFVLYVIIGFAAFFVLGGIYVALTWLWV